VNECFQLTVSIGDAFVIGLQNGELLSLEICIRQRIVLCTLEVNFPLTFWKEVVTYEAMPF
jgi:hypothetical protein